MSTTTLTIKVTTDASKADILQFIAGLDRDGACLNNWYPSEGDSIPVTLASYEINDGGSLIKGTYGEAE